MRVRLILAAIMLAPIVTTAGHATLAVTPRIDVAAVTARAEAANFDGAILVGDASGNYRVVTPDKSSHLAEATWRWASITKQFAAVIAMQEVDKATLDLDAPVTRYWQDWKAPEGGKIRIRDLLRHTSGLPQPDASPADGDGVPAFYRASAATPEKSAADFCAGAARAAAPAAFEYNNCDTIVLAEVLRRITGKSFETLTRERIAVPAGMKDFGFYQRGLPIAGHVRPTGEGADVDPLIDMGVYGASGGAYGTIIDLWRFDWMLMKGDLLPPKARETMWQSSAETGYAGFQQWIYPVRLTGCEGETRVVERQGLIGGIEHRNFLFPEHGRAIIFFSRHRPADYGNLWEGKGFAHDVLSKVICG